MRPQEGRVRVTSCLGLDPGGEDQVVKIEVSLCLSPAPGCGAGGWPAMRQVCNRPTAWSRADGWLMMGVSSSLAKMPFGRPQNGRRARPHGQQGILCMVT